MNPQEEVIKYIDWAIADLEEAKELYLGEKCDYDMTNLSLDTARERIAVAIMNVAINRHRNAQFEKTLMKIES